MAGLVRAFSYQNCRHCQWLAVQWRFRRKVDDITEDNGIAFSFSPCESHVPANCGLILFWIPEQVWVFSIYSFSFQMKALCVAALRKR